MKRLGELDSKVIVEQSTPPKNKHVIWKDPEDNSFKEFSAEGWTDSDKIAPAGGGSNEFPYEYACPDDFSITIKPEDWDIDKESWARVNIETIQLPNAYCGCVAKCNNVLYDSYTECFHEIYIPFIDDVGEVSFTIDNNKITHINVGVYQTIDPSDIQPLTLNFTNLVFIGAKKTE